MALTCPKCEKINKCDCKTCNPDGTATDLVIILEDEGLYQCSFCSHKFNEQDSLDFDWDRMHQNFKKSITPSMCITWKSFLLEKERKEFVSRYSYGNYGFESAFHQHFGIRHDQCGREELEGIKLQVERDKNLNKILGI
jgi:hypothetical protein